MEKIRIDSDNVLDILGAAVDVRGEDYTYTEHFDSDSCQYFVYEEGYDGDGDPIGQATPGCLVGTALHMLDPRLDDWLMSKNDENVYGLFGVEKHRPDELPDVVSSNWNELEIEVTKEAFIALQKGQTAQDTGSSWGSALYEARHSLKIDEEA